MQKPLTREPAAVECAYRHPQSAKRDLWFPGVERRSANSMSPSDLSVDASFDSDSLRFGIANKFDVMRLK